MGGVLPVELERLERASAPYRLFPGRCGFWIHWFESGPRVSGAGAAARWEGGAVWPGQFEGVIWLAPFASSPPNFFPFLHLLIL